MQNFYSSPGLFRGDVVSLEGDEYFHATRACRVRVGDRIGVTDGLGRRVEACIGHIDHTVLDARIVRDISGEGEPSLAITLALSLIKPARFEIAVEKCTELGVRRIVPFAAKRCERGTRLNLERLRRIALEAAKQSGRSWIPEIGDITGVEAMCGMSGVLLVAAQGAEREIGPELPREAGSGVILCIGPEGDFTPEERECMAGGGAVPVSLGGLTLRAETAAIVGVARAAAAFG